MVRERTASEDIVHRIEEAEQHFVNNVDHMHKFILSSVKEELSGQVAGAVQRFVPSYGMPRNILG